MATPPAGLLALALAMSCAGCVAAPGPWSEAVVPADLIPLEEARSLIASGQVEEIFQPHVGCVVLTLRDGTYVSFNQPHLDWVLGYLRENDLESKVDRIFIE